MKFSGLMCLGMNSICGKTYCKQWQVWEKLLCRHKCVSTCTQCIRLNDAHISQSVPCAFERMIHNYIRQSAQKVFMHFSLKFEVNQAW